MGQVTVTLNGCAYRLGCGDGEEERVISLASHVRSKLDGLVQQFGQAGNDRLLLISALLIADELQQARAHALGIQSEPPGAAYSPPNFGMYNPGTRSRVSPFDPDSTD